MTSRRPPPRPQGNYRGPGLGASPDVRVVAPKLELHRDTEELPHTFLGEKLCLHLPGGWTPSMYIAHTTVPWTSEWPTHQVI